MKKLVAVLVVAVAAVPLIVVGLTPSVLNVANRGLGMGGGSSRLAWATDFAAHIGAASPTATRFIVAWETLEGAQAAANNPLNTTLAEPGAVALPGNPAGVKMYPSLDVGLAANLTTIGGAGYGAVVAGLQRGDIAATATALQASPWCPGCAGYGTGVAALAASYSDPAVYARAGSVAAGTTALGSAPAAASAAPADPAAFWAFLSAQLGKPYQWAGAGPNVWDCSGLTMAAYATVGIPLAHNATIQYAQTQAYAVTGGLAALQPGDLIFWATNPADPATIHHVGIYVGGGQVLDAPHTGTVVQIQRLWTDGLYGATRPALALTGGSP